jgi:hypothetical protein
MYFIIFIPVGEMKIRQVAKATRHHQKHPLQLKKKFGGGKSQKIRQRVFLVGRAGARARRRWG